MFDGNVLPSNQSIESQRVAHFIEDRARENYKDLAIDSMSCHVSVLPHLAFALRVNIDGMKEIEARKYLSVINKRWVSKGTVGTVEDVINIPFPESNTKLIEWFEADDLECGDFRVSLNIPADLSIRYGVRHFELSRCLINEQKNVRSHLHDFDISFPTSKTDIEVASGGVSIVRLDKQYKPDPIELGVESSSGGVTIVHLDQQYKPDQLSTEYKLQGGMVWRF